jgi:very-short-patch-repair endonuclease
MLVLEVDGSQHYTEDGEAYDKDRTAILEALGYSVLRVSNDDVDRNFSGVCELIDNVVRKRIQILEKK